MDVSTEMSDISMSETLAHIMKKGKQHDLSFGVNTQIRQYKTNEKPRPGLNVTDGSKLSEDHRCAQEEAVDLAPKL